jgi:hypothetical protein
LAEIRETHKQISNRKREGIHKHVYVSTNRKRQGTHGILVQVFFDRGFIQTSKPNDCQKKQQRIVSLEIASDTTYENKRY